MSVGLPAGDFAAAVEEAAAVPPGITLCTAPGPVTGDWRVEGTAASREEGGGGDD